MRVGIFIREQRWAADERLQNLTAELDEAGISHYEISKSEDILADTDFIICVGGDGSFLSAASMLGPDSPALLGVNFGRLGFLSENRAEDVPAALKAGDYVIEQRTLLQAHLTSSSLAEDKPFALNEIAVHRAGAAMLGVDVSIDGTALPTYWADGLLVATSSGSTAYSLSVGGPIVLPESKVLIIAPIASHNLNVRPLIVPNTSKIKLSFRSRDEKILLTMDNRTMEISPDSGLDISMAQFSLRRVRLKKSNFINALTEKLHWGEDIRNSAEQH